MIGSEEYARRAAASFTEEARSAVGLYSPVGEKAMELEQAIRDDAGEEAVIASVATMMRLLLAPAVVFGTDAPQVDHGHIGHIWSIGTQKSRYLASVRELQMLSASYVGVAASLEDDPFLRVAKLERMAREAKVMLEHLDVTGTGSGISPSSISATVLRAKRERPRECRPEFGLKETRVAY